MRLLYPGVGVALVVALLGKFAPARVTAQSAPSYGTITLSAGPSPSAAKIGDLGGDGTDALTDLIAVNRTSGTITVPLSSRGSDPPPPVPAQLTLTASTRKTFTASVVDLEWNGATGSKLDLYRDGARLATIPNTGSYTDRLNSRTQGIFNYRVCLLASGTCSNQSVINF